MQYDSLVSTNVVLELITKINDSTLRHPAVVFDFEDARFLASSSFSRLMVFVRLGTLYNCRILARGYLS